MKTLLLVAGRSRRFWPLQEKSLFPICGKPLLGHVIERLEAAGCSDIILIGGNHNLQDVRGRFPDLPAIEQEQLELGMRGALLSALPQLPDTDILIVSSNDLIESEAYRRTIDAGKAADGAILAQRVSRYFPGGYLSTNGTRITGIVEKPGEGKEPSDLVNIVCHYHRSSSALLAALEDVNESTDDGYEQALVKLFSTKHFNAVPYDGYWQAVKYPWHLLRLLPALLPRTNERSIHPSAQIHATAVIEGDVVIGEGARLLPHAVVVGPSVIGARTIVGNNALIRGSSVGNDCVVGYNTEVKGSVLADFVWTHSTYIGDSVVGRNVSFGGGTVTGNLRLDEAEILSHVGDERIRTGVTKFGTVVGNDTRIGIGVLINPGVKIGGGTFVASGCMVEEDVPDRSFCRMKEGILAIKENTASAPKPEEREQYRNSI